MMSAEGITGAMNNLGFIASVVGSLAIPVTVVAALLIFRRPLTDLLGRIISYEGLGQKVSFGQKLAGAEESVSRAVAQAPKTVEQTQLDDAATDNSVTERTLRALTILRLQNKDIDLQNAGLLQLAELATSNPSFVVIKAWEDLYAQLTAMVKSVFPDADVHNPVYWFPELVKGKHIRESFPSAVLELLDLRNSVAHGQHNPTPGEAVAYVESARDLTNIARRVADYNEGRRDSQRLAERIQSERRSEPGKAEDPRQGNAGQSP
jgi:hypothetical protein